MDPHPRDEAKEAVLGEIISHGSDAVLSFLNDTCTVVKDRMKKQATVIEEWRRKDMIMMAPVTQCWCKKEPVVTAPVTEQSPAR